MAGLIEGRLAVSRPQRFFPCPECGQGLADSWIGPCHKIYGGRCVGHCWSPCYLTSKSKRMSNLESRDLLPLDVLFSMGKEKFRMRNKASRISWPAIYGEVLTVTSSS